MPWHPEPRLLLVAPDRPALLLVLAGDDLRGVVPILGVVGCRPDEVDLLHRSVGLLQFGLDSRHHHIAVAAAGESALARERRIGNHLDPQPPEGAFWECCLDLVGVARRIGSLGDPGAVVESAKGGPTGRADFQRFERLPRGGGVAEETPHTLSPRRGERLDLCLLRPHRRRGVVHDPPQPRELLLLPRIGQAKHGIAVSAPTILGEDPLLGDGVKEGIEREKLPLRDRVVLVVVTAAAANCEAKPRLARRLHPVDDRLDEPLLGDQSSLAVEPMVAIEAGGHDVVARGAGQHVSGELLHGELIERHVGIERPDHPVAPRPVGAAGVGLKAVAVGIAGGVEPFQRHPLAEVLAGQELLHILLVGVGRWVGYEGIDIGWQWRQPGEVDRQPPRERLAVGLGIRRKLRPLEPRKDEAVDRTATPRRIANRRHLRPFHPRERPVALILGPLLDPAVEDCGLRRRDRLAEMWRRHHDVGIGARNPGEKFTLVGLSRHDRPRPAAQFSGGVGGQIETQARLSLGIIGAVAGEAPVGEDRPHVAIERDPLAARIFGRPTAGGHEQHAEDDARVESGVSHGQAPSGKHPRRRSAVGDPDEPIADP